MENPVPSSPPNHHFLLFRGIRGLLRCDEAEVVSGIARYVMTQYPSLRIGSKWMARTRKTPIPPFFALLGGLTRSLEVLRPQSREGVVWVARLGNERRAIQQVIAPLESEMNLTELKFSRRPDSASISALAAMRIKGLATTARRIMRLTRLLHRRYEFFRLLRVVELIGYYASYLRILQESDFKLAVMSSHSNPHGIAFNLAARKSRVPVVLITHGMPVRPVAKLAYDLALVHCEAARQIYLEEGSRIDRILIHGRRREYSAMRVQLPQRLAVGVFLCKDVNEENFRRMIDCLLTDARVFRIIVRPHPKNLWLGLHAWIDSRNESRLRISRDRSPSADVAASDVVLGGNSSVLVDAVTAGRPSGYVAGLDYGPPDLHSFVARGLIYPVENWNGGIDFDQMLDFYRRPEWIDGLRFFARIDEDDASVEQEFRSLMLQVAGHPDRDAPAGFC